MMKSTPKISVIMPYYNCAKFLDESIKSILNQTFSDFEFIIIDDCSTDESAEIVKRYLRDERIIFIKNQTNKKITYNLNLGLKLAKSNIIARIDGDDTCESSRFAKQYEFLLNNNEVSVVGSFIKIINENGEQIDYRTKPISQDGIIDRIFYYSPLAHNSLMFRKDVVENIGGYRQLWEKFPEDLDLYYRLILSGYKIANIPEFLVSYRYTPTSCAHESKTRALVEFRLKKKIIKDFDVSVSIKVLVIIYVQFLINYIVTGRQRQYIEGLIKKIFFKK